MKNLKKFMALGLAMVMVLSLAACGGESNTTTESTTKSTTNSTAATTSSAATTEPTTAEPEVDPFEGEEIVLYSAQDFTVGGASLATDSWYWQGAGRNALNEWCEAHNATWTQINSGDGTILLSMIAADKAPDIYFGYGIWPNWANLGYLEDFTDYVEEYGLEEKYGQDLIDGQYNGKQLAIFLPNNEPTILSYNVTMFEEYGVKTPKEYFMDDEWDFAAFEEVVNNIAQDTDDDGVNDIVGPSGFHWVFANNSKGVSMDASGRLTYCLNTDRNLDLNEMYYRLFSVEKSMSPNKWDRQKGANSNGYYMAMHFDVCDFYDPIASRYVWTIDGDGDVWEYISVPVWKAGEEDTDYAISKNYFAMAIPRGVSNLEASVSVMDFMIECICARVGVPGFGPDTDYVGLTGTTEESETYLEWYTELQEETLETLMDLDEWDEEYLEKLTEWVQSAKIIRNYGWSGVSAPGVDTFGSRPAADVIAELEATMKAGVDKYNSTYVFSD